MAAFTNLISFTVFSTLLFTLQINARESQFFSKANHFTSNNNNVKENEFPTKETPVSKPEQEPVFIPETESSYGLYGHETSQNPPSTTTTTNYAPYTTPTTTTYQPYKTESEEEMNKYNNKKNMYYSYHKDAYVYDNNNQNEFGNTKLTGNAYSTKNNNYNYYKDAYGTHENELSNTRYTEEGYNTLKNQENNNKYQKYYNKYNNNAAEINNRYNSERQGMSDTRFMENGKYFYDLNKEKYNPTSYNTYSNKGSVESRNWNNYFGKNNKNNNNGNFYENNNSMEEFQNQEEFEDDQVDFQP